MEPKILKRVYTSLLLGLIASLIVIITTTFIWPSLFDAFEAKSLDNRFTQRIKHLWEQRDGASIEDIVIIDIDDRSLEKLGHFKDWPRSYHADIIQYISQSEAWAIGFDVLFLETDSNSKNDSLLIQETRFYQTVYHALTFTNADDEKFTYRMTEPPADFEAEKFSIQLDSSVTKNFITADRLSGNVFNLYNSSAGVGFTNFFPDNDSVIRHMPLLITFADRQYPSLSLVMLAGILGIDINDINVDKNKIVLPIPNTDNEALKIPIDDKAQMLINYQGTFRTFRYISYYDVLKKRVPADFFRGKIILVGTSAAGLSDIRPVPFQGAFPGVEVHANVIYNILTQEFIKYQPLWLIIGAILFYAVLIALSASLLKPWQSLLIMVGIFAIHTFRSYYHFSHDAFWIDALRPILSGFFAYLFVFIYRFVNEEQNKKVVKNMFQHYLTASVVDDLLKNPDKLQLGGEKRFATAFFSDVANFTTISESLEPEELVSQLNEYLSTMTSIILKYDGYLDKYEGDAIMAIFGVPIEQPDHADRACLAALEMNQEMVRLRKKWERENKPAFHIRIGINSGYMIAGNIGGTNRFDYTVIGDAVNLASRLEGVNKMYGTGILISQFTKEILSQKFMLREIDSLRVKGKTQPVQVFELREQIPEEFLNEYTKALTYYRQQNWDEAIQQFNKCFTIAKNDNPTKIFIDRCQKYKNTPPPNDWDGVYDLETK